MGMKFNPLTGQMNVLPNTSDLKAAKGALFMDTRSRLYPVGCRNGVLYDVSNGSTSYAQSIRRQVLNGGVSLKNIRIRLPNWYVSTSTGAEALTGNRIKVNISIESPRNSTPRPFYANGSRDIFIENGQTVEVLDRTGLVINANANFYLHIYVTAVDSAGNQLTSGKIPRGRATTNFGGNVEKLTLDASATDHTTVQGGETTAPGSPANLYHPFAILGEPLYAAINTAPAVIGFGDSIMVGRTEVDIYGSDSNGNSGWCERWLGNTSYGVGFINCAVSSTKANQWAGIATAGSYNRLLQGLDGVGTHTLCVLGVNDAATDTGAAIMSNVLTMTNFFKNALGLRNVVGTLTPISATADLWATLANQSGVIPNTANRASLNGLIRGGGYDGSVSGFIDGGAVMESGSTGKWIVTGSANGYCGDNAGQSGVHMVAAGHALLASSLPNPLSVFGFA